MKAPRLGLGIDTGGTFTDGALVELESGRVVSKAKALTTRADLLLGIRNCLASLDRSLFPEVRLTGLSTTLATNSIVEGKGARVGLLLLVPDPRTFALPGGLPAEQTVVLAGAHDRRGEESVPLDLEAAEGAVRRLSPLVDAFAVTGYFSIYNAAHEVRIREVIAAACGKPVVCGHELSGDVGLLERGTTAALNARLLPVIGELLGAVRSVLDEIGVRGPLLVVKGDGSLLKEETAAAVPVETVLSGPAASVVGACRLTGLADAVIVDMGGTTSDVAVVRNGAAATSRDGALIGGWKTRVHAVDMWTVGLGGDSRISVRSKREIRIGPRRAVPLCLAARTHPELKERLLAFPRAEGRRVGVPEFATLVRRPLFPLSRQEQKLLEALDGRAVERERLEKVVSPFVSVDRFVELGYVAEIAFTPTDLLHAAEKLELWDVEAARAALRILAARADLPEPELVELLSREITEALKLSVASKVLADSGEGPEVGHGDLLPFLGRLLRRRGGGGLAFSPRLEVPLVGVGAPAAHFFPTVAEELGARLFIPEHAEVANAVGAVTGRVVEKAEMRIRPAHPEGFAVVSPDAQRRFGTLDEAVAFATEHTRSLAFQRARESGGGAIHVVLEREEDAAPLAQGWGDDVLLELKITATAVGTPIADGEGRCPCLESA